MFFGPFANPICEAPYVKREPQNTTPCSTVLWPLDMRTQSSTLYVKREPQNTGEHLSVVPRRHAAGRDLIVTVEPELVRYMWSPS